MMDYMQIKSIFAFHFYPTVDAYFLCEHSMFIMYVCVYIYIYVCLCVWVLQCCIRLNVGKEPIKKWGQYCKDENIILNEWSHSHKTSVAILCCWEMRMLFYKTLYRLDFIKSYLIYQFKITASSCLDSRYHPRLQTETYLGIYYSYILCVLY